MLNLLHGGAEGAEGPRDLDDDPVAKARGVDLDELCRLAAREMIATALEAERRAYLDAHADVVDANGSRMVVGNGHARERRIITAAGRVEVRAPRVDDRREGQRFTSAILPPSMRRSPTRSARRRRRCSRPATRGRNRSDSTVVPFLIIESCAMHRP